MELFKTEKITEHITRITDITHTACYLMEGDTRACLIDTGAGVGSLRACVESLTEKDYFVSLTHGHVDHAGGVGEFSDKDVYLHPADLALMKIHATREMREDYVLHTSSAEPPANELYVPSLSPDQTLPLQDGQVFDLGGQHIEIIHTPGHTQGMCMTLFQEERVILFGDGCGVGVLLLDEYASSVEEYHQMLTSLKKFEPRYDRIIRNHGTCESPKELLDNVIECCAEILAGTDDHAPGFHPMFDRDDIFYAKAMKTDGYGRADGKEGNILYSMDKISLQIKSQG